MMSENSKSSKKTTPYKGRFDLSFADFQFPILTWEKLFLVEPRVYAVLGQAGVESAHGVTVRVGVAEEDFERAFVVNGLHNGFTD